MKLQSSTHTKGFTLIELLVVIAIVAVLAVVVLLTLNPAQLLKQARDSNRVSDLATLKSALALYLADVSSPTLGTTTNCYVHPSSTITAAGCGRFTGGTATGTASNAVDGSGWIPVNFNSISSGAPISVVPVDPVNNASFYYSYRASSSLTYELTAAMESTKYGFGGSGDVVTNDGGNQTSSYEVGTAPGLAL
jgi:prepilin-type N-terminal cleavage/methylation domain-containing protein